MREIREMREILAKPKQHLPIVPYVLEQIERLAQTILRGVLSQRQIVAAHGRDEYDRSNVVEALYPLSSLVSLATDVEHTWQEKQDKRNTGLCIRFDLLSTTPRIDR